MTTYLPNNENGIMAERNLRKAFDQRILFRREGSKLVSNIHQYESIFLAAASRNLQYVSRSFSKPNNV